ncbi:PREDICTED: putative 1-phosphatidylinositol-3-phosphate 5-kinase FAB1C [Theobroma cacao]|uniref:1-phosphatidylinositol-3-phosphate 5-kinase n=1 Tax=Theobroma cacao TaxID=3641 RepID=A0AB32VJU1_THECC|nr:PREDICTED: putative 1-phosphatidylinositol-3-phosphate 5-kinase FAB1C [Theobroma cacao]
MGIPDSSLLDLIEKVRSWISWGASDISCFPGEEFGRLKNGVCKKMCCECDMKFADEFSHRYRCQSCGRWLCSECVERYESRVVVVVAAEQSANVKGNDFSRMMSVKSCKFCCDGVKARRESGGRKYCEKVHPSESPRESPEPPSPCSVNSESIKSDHLARYLEARDCRFSLQAVTGKSMTSFSAHPSPVSTRRSPSRSDEEDADDSGKHFVSPWAEYCHDVSDLDSSSISARHEFYSFKSVGSSPSVSPSRNNFTPYRVGHSVQRRQEGSPMAQYVGPFDQENMAVLRKPETGSEEPENIDDYSDDMSVFRNHYAKSQKPLDFENNGLIWYPPPPEDENDEAESSFFTYDDEDDDIGDSGAMFSSSSSLSSMFPAREKQNEGNKEPLRAVIRGHFRALVSQLLQGEGIKVGKEDNAGDWLDIVTAIAWQAANFVKPDTSRGGSMDPGDYVKVKCMASGTPSESTLVKGVVCTKNIKHKRMTSQYKNPRLLLLGGALEFLKVPNQLASFNTLLQQENDHLKMIIAKIEALRPNVLLVEKSVSSYAQEYLLAKEISLVLNVKRPLLERIARCTGALICPSIDNLSAKQLGHCELFRLEKVTEEHEMANQFNKKPSKTLMFFEGCPRRLGCTVLLRGRSREELKKVKHVVQYAVFAAYHLSLETSFLADEGATLPKMKVKRSIAVPEKTQTDNAISVVPSSSSPSSFNLIVNASAQDDASLSHNSGHGGLESLSEPYDQSHFFPSSGGSFLDACNDDLAHDEGLDMCSLEQFKDLKMSTTLPCDIRDFPRSELQETMTEEERHLGEIHEMAKFEKIDEDEASSEYFSATDTHQSILVSFSSRCVLKGTVCERSRLLRIKFYGSFDKPLGRYLRDDLFDQASCCRSCNEPAEGHVICYTHQQGNLTINVRRLSSLKLPGERDGKIWMWHRCLRCAHIDGVPPATHRVVMSDAAWGLSFGKFLELSFSNHATANRVATCGHSLQRDCLRFYGFGNMVAFFRYSPIDILSVHLPPSMLEFSGDAQQEWIRKDAAELMVKMEMLYADISDVLDHIEQKSNSASCQSSNASELPNHIMELRDQLRKERNDYNGLLQPVVMETSPLGLAAVDILELNRLRRSLLIASHVWDRQLHSLDSLLKKGSAVKADMDHIKDGKPEAHEPNACRSSDSQEPPKNDIGLEQNSSLTTLESVVPEESNLALCHQKREEDVRPDESIPSPASTLSEKIDSAWTGTDLLTLKVQPPEASQGDGPQAGSIRPTSKIDNLTLRKIASPMRLHSFDSVLRFQERIQKGLYPSSLHFLTLRSFHASGEYRSMVRDPVSNVMSTYSYTLPLEAQKLNLLLSSTPTLITSASHMAEGARLLLPQRGHSDIVIAVYDSDPASIIAYALSSKEYEEWVADKSYENGGGWSVSDRSKEDSVASNFSPWQSFGSLDLDYIHYRSFGSEDASSSVGALFADTKRSPHLTVSFGDDSSAAGGKVKFSVTCYFAKQFDSLRRKCCPSELDFLCSLSRCQKWSAQGGKSNVYFAKSLDERFIIKQVQKTELESFDEFAPEYFKYLTDSLSSGSPTCLAKILGIYQVSVKHLKGGKETKMDFMVMENLFFRRSISRVYDLKGSARSRYNPDTTGTNKVLLDMNLLEALRTEPIFLGSKAKRSLERAIWNDTSFLASVAVMDYSLLVGVDEERKELVLGIIDYMRQYTWDKHLETWVKASGILGGPKNASPTIISPKQYKKRFRKAMTTYFLTVPDQWTS